MCDTEPVSKVELALGVRFIRRPTAELDARDDCVVLMDVLGDETSYPLRRAVGPSWPARVTLSFMASAAEWSKRVSEWRESGQTSEQFARGRGFAGATLLWWSSRLRQRRAANPEVRLAHVVRASAPPAAMPVVVEMHGARVLIAAGADRKTLAAIFDALTGASA